jgi:hypothetical protein
MHIVYLGLNLSKVFVGFSLRSSPAGLNQKLKSDDTTADDDAQPETESQCLESSSPRVRYHSRYDPSVV